MIGGQQIWILVPRYVLDEGGIFRVLPPNLCVFKHYGVEIIQEVIDEAMDSALSESSDADTERKRQAQLGGQDGEEVRPCDRTKRLWILWFYKNLLLMEAILRLIQFSRASMMRTNAEALRNLLFYSDFIQDLRISHAEEWLRIIIQAAWNTGRPLIPLRNDETVQDIYNWIQVHSIPAP